jgi:hypothetical protein
MENETRYNIVTDDDEILEYDLDLFLAETLLCSHINGGADAYIEIIEPEDTQ